MLENEKPNKETKTNNNNMETSRTHTNKRTLEIIKFIQQRLWRFYLWKECQRNESHTLYLHKQDAKDEGKQDAKEEDKQDAKQEDAKQEDKQDAKEENKQDTKEEERTTTTILDKQYKPWHSHTGDQHWIWQMTK